MSCGPFCIMNETQKWYKLQAGPIPAVHDPTPNLAAVNLLMSDVVLLVILCVGLLN